MNNPIVSLCIPTNGVIEWVFPVLDSIYSQDCDYNDFEVILTDNGNNKEFKEKINRYRKQYSNLYYFETKVLGFLNEIECYKYAKGQLIKFVNHRTCLVKGALQFLINLSKENVNEKPILYFTNGVLKKEKKSYKYDNFNQFIKALSYWSSWSTGMTIWKEDLLKLPENINNFNELFPHTTVLFAEQDRGKYIIDNTIIFDEIPQGKKPKGNYDLFYAFGVEYPALILDLYRSNSITVDTFKSVLNDNLVFIAYLYISYFIKKEYCSYDLTGLENMYDIFYTKKQLYKNLIKICIVKIINKIKNRSERIK
mgnify:CR=1 FL=1